MTPTDVFIGRAIMARIGSIPKDRSQPGTGPSPIVRVAPGTDVPGYGPNAKSAILNASYMWGKLLRKAIIGVAALCACWASSSASELDRVPARLAHCTIPGFEARNNDIRIREDDGQAGKLVTLPKAVEAAINTNTDWLTREYRRTDVAADDRASSLISMKNQTCRWMYPLANVVELPDGLKVYVVHAYGWISTYYYLLYIYDPATQRVTAKPSIFYGKWADKGDALLRRPYVSVADLRGDGHRQIVFEERAHNLMAYDAVVYSYYDIGPNLEMTSVLAFEARALDEYELSNMVTRTLTRLSFERQRIDVFYKPHGKGQKRKYGGYAILESEGAGKPFHVVERHPSRFNMTTGMDNDRELITSSGRSDDDFLREGYTFHY